MAARKSELDAIEQEQAETARQQAQTAAEQRAQQDTLDALCLAVEQERESYAAAKKIYDERSAALSDASARFKAWAAKVKVAAKGPDGKIGAYTIMELWQQHVRLRQRLPAVPEQTAVRQEADIWASIPRRAVPAPKKSGE